MFTKICNFLINTTINLFIEIRTEGFIFVKLLFLIFLSVSIDYTSKMFPKSTHIYHLPTLSSISYLSSIPRNNAITIELVFPVPFLLPNQLLTTCIIILQIMEWNSFAKKCLMTCFFLELNLKLLHARPEPS